MKDLIIETGDYITVTKWKNSDDKSYTDDILEVKGIDGNLIAVQNAKYPTHHGIFILNTDRVIVRKITNKFAELFIKDKK